MNNGVPSCRQKILLNHPYYNVFPVTVSPDSAKNVKESILYTIFILNDPYGTPQSDLVNKTIEIFPQYTRDEVCSTLQSMLKTGIVMTLNTLSRNWCIGGYGCSLISSKTSPGISYNPRMDLNNANYDLVLYLIQLSGGTRSYSRTFNNTFLPFVDPSKYGIANR